MKKNKLKNTFSIIKASLIGVVVNLLAVLIFAIVLKFAHLPLNIISYVNNGIKILSIFIMVVFLKKFSTGNLFISSLLSGVLYALLSFFIFSILNGGIVLDMTTLYDVVFAVIASIATSIIVNVLKRKNV